MYEITYTRTDEAPAQSPGAFTRPQAVNEVDALLASGADIITVFRSVTLQTKD